MANLKSLRDRRRTDYPYHLEYRTRWADNDMYNHMNNSIYLFLFDSIINTYLMEHCGRNPVSSEEVGIVVRSECNFFQSVAFPAMLDLGLKVSQLGESSVAYEVGVFEQGQEQVKAVGGYTHVFVDRAANRPMKSGMSTVIREGLMRLVSPEKAKL